MEKFGVENNSCREWSGDDKLRFKFNYFNSGFNKGNKFKDRAFEFEEFERAMEDSVDRELGIDGLIGMSKVIGGGAVGGDSKN